MPVVIWGRDALGMNEEALEEMKQMLGEETPLEFAEMWITFRDTKAARVHTISEAVAKLSKAGAVQVGPV